MQKSLSLQTLGDLDGGAAGLIIDAAIREVLADLDDRGDDEQARRVSINLSLKKHESGLVEAHVEASAHVPKRRTAGTMSRLSRDARQQSRLTFQDGAPDNPDQRTLDEVSQ